jgi:alanine-glyoxylate transaminase/serine-glyoxylate transaminase/serine-pyruvate transaminase
MLFGTLGAVEIGLEALKLPHGKNGLAAAVEFMAKEVRA